MSIFYSYLKKNFCRIKNDCIFAVQNAEVAQLVEHDLAKVGVASPSLVFRSNPQIWGFFYIMHTLKHKYCLNINRLIHFHIHFAEG